MPNPNLTINEKVVYDWIKLILPTITVLKSEQQFVKPVKPYITFKILNAIPLGRPTQKTTDTKAVSGDYEATVSTQYKASVSIQAFGDNMEESLQFLQSSVASTKVKNLGQTNRVHFAESKPIKSATVKIDDNWETRYIFEITIRYAISFDIQAPVIEEITIEADIDGITFETKIPI